MVDLDQDQIFLNEYFANLSNGRALIIGANHGQGPASDLIVKGWNAVCCEPDPHALCMFLTEKEPYLDQITLINSAIVPTKGQLTPFYLSMIRHAMSSLHQEWLDLQVDRKVCPPNEAIQRQILTNTLSFQDLLDYVGTDFDLVVIDAEGIDAELIGSIDWKQLHKCKIVCTEDVGASGHALELAGFHLHHRSSETRNFFYSR